MVGPKLYDLFEDINLEPLKQNKSYTNIVKQVKQMGHNVSAATVNRI
jgi:hypothetical protein